MSDDAQNEGGAEVVALKPVKRQMRGDAPIIGGTDALKAAGVEFDTHVPWQDMSLPEPSYGETALRDLTDDEAVTYYEIWRTNQELNDHERTVFGGALTKVGKSIAESDRNKPLHELAQEGSIIVDFNDGDEAETYFRLIKKRQVLMANFFWGIAEEQGSHSMIYAVRRPAKGSNHMRLVSLQNRYQGGEDA